MNEMRSLLLALLVSGALSAPAMAQDPPPGPPEAAEAPDAAAPPASDPAASGAGRRFNNIFRFGSDYVLPPGDRVREVAIILGDATLEGQVDDSVAVILGTLRLGPNSSVAGDVAVIGGDLVVESGAQVGRDLALIGGVLDAPPDFSPGREQVIIGPTGLGTGARAVLPWVSRGLLWGRLIVPDVPWVWVAVALWSAVYLGLGLIFGNAVRTCRETLADRPLSTLLAGMITLLLVGPVVFILIASFVGLTVVPFLLGGLVFAGIVGKAGVFQWIGVGLLGEERSEGRPQSVLALAIGLALATLAYMVPVLGLLAWGTLGVFGLGAAAIAIATALRKENPPGDPAAAEPRPAVPPAGAAGGSEPDTGDAARPAAEADLALFPRATFLVRTAAFFLDFLLVMMAFGLLGLDDPGRFLLLFLVYHVAFWTWKQATVGGIICQFRIVRTDGAGLRFADSLVRGLSGIFSLAALGLGCFWVLWDPERQAWHDRIAGTYVVRVPRDWRV